MSDAHKTAAGDERSVPGLLHDVISQISSLFRQELRLARSEIAESASNARSAVITVAGGFVLGLAALVVLLDALVYGLAQTLPMWLSAVLVGGAAALAGLLLVMKGKSQLSASNLAPDRTIRSLNEDAELVKDKMS